MATSLSINSASLMARYTIKLESSNTKRKHGQLAKANGTNKCNKKS